MTALVLPTPHIWLPKPKELLRPIRRGLNGLVGQLRMQDLGAGSIAAHAHALSNIEGGRAGGVLASGNTPPGYSLASSAEDATDVSGAGTTWSYTFSAQSIGAAPVGIDRYIFICVGAYNTQTFDTTSVTVGGNSATERVDTPITTGAKCWIWVCPLNTGSSADIVVSGTRNNNSTLSRCGIAVFAVYTSTDLDVAAYDSGGGNHSGGVVTLSVDGENTSLMIACAQGNTLADASVVWGNATEEHDVDMETDDIFSSATYYAVSSYTGRSVTADGGLPSPNQLRNMQGCFVTYNIGSI